MLDPETRTVRRFNRRALVVMLALCAILGAGAMALQLTRASRLGGEATQQIEQLVEDGQVDLALRHLGRYLQNFPDDREMLILQARLRAERISGPNVNELERVVGLHKRLVNRYPDHPEIDKVKARLADLYIRLTDLYRAGYKIPEEFLRVSLYEAAQVLADQLIAKDGDDPVGHFLRGKAMEGMLRDNAPPGDVVAVIDTYLEALDLNETILARSPDDKKAASDSSEIALRIARLRRDRQGDPDAAKEVFDRLAGIRPDDPEPWLVRYEFYRNNKELKDAKEAIDTALDLAPDDPIVSLAAVDYALSTWDTGKARDVLEAIPEEGRAEIPGQISLFAGRIELQEQPGNPEPALIEWQDGLRGGGQDLSWWIAYVLIKANRLGEANTHLEQYRRLSGGEDSPDYQFLLALRSEMKRDHEDAIEILSELQRKDAMPELIRDETLLALARCHEKLGNRSEAERSYRDALGANPRSSVPIVSRALFLERSGKSREAIGLLSNTLDRQGKNIDIQVLIPLMQLLLVEQADRPQARREWGEFDGVAAKAKDFNVDKIEVMLADREALDGRADLADARLRAALDRSPKSPTLQVARADLLKRLGRRDEAIALLEKTAGDDPTLRIALARLLIDRGEGREAQRRLIEGIEEPNRFSAGQKAELWQAIGLFRKAQADYDGARTALMQWRDLAPDSPDPDLALIDIALLADRLLDAERHLERLKRNGETPSYLMARASILLRGAERNQGDLRGRLLDSAAGAINKVLASAPDLAPALLLSGRIQEALGNPEAAVDAYRRAWSRNHREALPKLADLLIKLKRFDDLEKLVTAPGSGADAGAGRLSAQALLGAGQVDRANRLFESAGEAGSSAAFANAWRARLFKLSGRLDELENRLQIEASRSDVGNSAPWIELVTTKAQLGRDRAALDVTIGQALRHLSAIPSPLVEARLRWAIGDAEAADEALEGALDDDNPALIIGASSYYQETGRPDLAEPLLERLMNDPEVGSAAALDLALLLADRAAGDPATWQRALELASDGPMDTDRRLAVAVVQARAPDPERRREAVRAFEDLMADLSPMHPKAVAARDQLSRLLLELKEPERASQVAAISASQPASPPEAISWHVRTLLAAGRASEADAELTRLELLRPGDPEVATLRAEQLLRAGSNSPDVLLRQALDRIDSPGGNLFARSAALQLLTIDSPEASRAAEELARTLAGRDPRYRWLTALVLATQGQADAALEGAALALETVDLTDDTDRLSLTEAIMGAIRVSSPEDRTALVGRARPIIDAMLGRRAGDPDLLIASAVLRHQVEDYEAEARLYRQVLERRPGDRLAHYNLALVLSEGLDRPEEALGIIDRLANRVGAIPPVLGARGVILTRLGKFDEAIEDLERAVEIEPSADRHYFLARAYHKAGRDDRFRSQLDLARRAGLAPELIDRWQHDEMRELLSL